MEFKEIVYIDRIGDLVLPELIKENIYKLEINGNNSIWKLVLPLEMILISNGNKPKIRSGVFYLKFLKYGRGKEKKPVFEILK